MHLTSGWRRVLGDQLLDGKNLGKKNCELSEEDIAWVCETFLAFKENEHSKIFDNAAFDYWKVTVERPLRIEGIDPNRAYKPEPMRTLEEIRADILALEKETDGLLDEILGRHPINQAAPGSGAETIHNRESRN